MAYQISADERTPEVGTHYTSDSQYVLVALFLAVMTAIEVLISYHETALGVSFVWLLLSLMVIKFGTVAWYFMHLKNDPKMCRRVFLFGLCVAIFVFCAALSTLHYWAHGFR